MKSLIPIYDDTAPIACTIGEDEIPARVELLERMRANVTSIERAGHGLLLRFPRRDDVEADARQLAVDEKRCCEFWGFEVTVDDDRVTLRWDGPPSASELIDLLQSYFEGDEPITKLAALL